MDGERTVIHPLSGIAPLSQFELWAVAPTQVSVLKDIEDDVRQLSTLSANQPIEFMINTAVDEYLNMNETYLYVKAKVKLTKNDKKEIKKEDWDSVIPANYFLHSLFSQCEVTIGDKEVTLSPQTYHYRSYIEALLGFSDQAKTSYMRACGWTNLMGERNKMIRPKIDSDSDGRVFELMGRLHTDLSFQDKSLLGGIKMRIKLIPNDPKLYFTCKEGLKPELELIEVYLSAHKSKVYPSLVEAHSQALSAGNTRYTITRSEVRFQSIPQGQLDAMMENVISGQLPRRIFVCLVDTTTFNGSYAKDVYTFNHFDMTYLAAYINSAQVSKAYTPNFDEDLYVREYMQLFNALNQNRTDTFASIDMYTFGHGKTIFAFDFAPDLSNGPGSSGHVNCIQKGTLRLHFRFKNRLAEPVNVLIFCEFDNIIEIDDNRKAITGFN